MPFRPSSILLGRGAQWMARGDGIGADIDIDFTSNAAYVNGLYRMAHELLTTTRGTLAWVDDMAGNWSQVAVNQARISNKGILVEETRINSLRNNSMQGAVAGTPGTLPTNWLIGGGLPSGISQQVVGVGVENGIDYVDLRFFGTPVTGNINVVFEANTQIVAAQNQLWIGSAFFKLSGGTTTNISSTVLATNDRGPAGAFISANSVAFTLAGITSLAANRIVSAYALPDVTTAFTNLQVQLGVTNGNPIDITLRIGWPQLEQSSTASGPFATSPIRTTAAAAQRSLDYVVMSGLTVGNALSLFAQGYSFDVAGRAANVIASIDDGSFSNRCQMYRNVATPNLIGFTSVAGANGPGLTSAATMASNVRHKTAIVSAVSDQAMTLDGGTIATQASNWPAACTQLAVGDIVGNTTFAWNGYVERISCWLNTRLSNLAIQQLTT